MGKIDWQELTKQDFGKVGSAFYITPAYIGASLLVQNVLTNGKGYVSSMDEESYVKENNEDTSGEQYAKKLESLGGRLLYKSFGDNFFQNLYVWDNGLVQLSFHNGYLKFSGLSQDEKWLSDLRQQLMADFEPPKKKGHIFAIVRHGKNLSISSIGNASIPLEVGNYTPQVIEDFKFVIKDLKSSSPSGRIVVMEGEPGTGKTHLVRALLSEVPDAMFVLVSPEMVPSLAGPELLPLLLQNKSNYAINGPIVLVLEDADLCLVTRGKDNINSIQSLLNLGDGILGSLLDLRIIATTNAKKLEMEAAILRPGRLSKRMEVGALDVRTAKAVFHRLLPNAKLPSVISESNSFKMTLAEVYALSRKNGWEPGQREIKRNNSLDKEDYDD